MAARCEIAGCGRPDANRVVWFTRGLGRQEAVMCQDCMSELWDNNLRSLCAMNEAAIIIRPISKPE